MQQQPRDLLRSHTADIRRPRWGQHESDLGNLVTTVHDDTATDQQAEAAAIAFIDAWCRHPVYRKTARYGLILWTLRYRPELADNLAAFDAHVQKLGHADTAAWYASYTGSVERVAA